MLAPGRARRYTENMKQVPVYREAVEVPALPGLFIRPLESSLLEKAQAAELLGPRAVAVCRELTKTHEEFILGRLEKWQELPEELLGEITVIIGPPEQKERADEAEARRALEAVMAAADERLKPKEVARRAQEMAPGWSAKELYELLTRA